MAVDRRKLSKACLCLAVAGQLHESYTRPRSSARKQVVVEHQINEEILALGADALLARHKGKAFVQFQQKGLQLVHQSLFSSNLPASGSPGNSSITGSRTKARGDCGRAARLSCASASTATQAFVIQHANLSLQRPRTPVLCCCLRHVPGARLGRIHPQQQAGSASSSIRDAVRRILEKPENPAHVAQIRGIKALAGLPGQSQPQA